MRKVLTFIGALLISASALAEPIEHCNQMMAFGYPTQTQVQDTTNLCRIAYFVKHDNTKKIPVYSAEYLVKDNLNGKVKRKNAFKADPDLHPDNRSELSDYDERVDRGHVAPFEDARTKSAAALQTFYLSNIFPQNKYLNRGLWRVIEGRARRFALMASNGVYVVTGPVFRGPKFRTIGNGVAYPDLVYKVIIDKETMQGVAYLVPNEGPKKGMTPEQFMVPISDVEKMTGINFTPGLKDGRFKERIGNQFKVSFKKK